MNKPPDETLKQGRNRSWLLVKFDFELSLNFELSFRFEFYNANY